MKVGGYRVNLEEIANQILRSGCSIDDVKVVALQGGRWRTRKLVAFVEGPSCDETGLALHLGTKLPSYMIPHLLVLKRFPRLVNGKTDMRALETLYEEKIDGRADTAFDEVEEKIAEIWRNILQAPATDPHRPFFELGGNSVDTINMLNQVNAVFDVDVPHRFYFENRLSIRNIGRTVMRKSRDGDNRPGLDAEEYGADRFPAWREREAELTPYGIMTTRGRRVVLTGASGFLGIHLLSHLLESNDVDHVYCLGRRRFGETFQDRILAASKRNALKVDLASTKLTLVDADMTQDRFGLAAHDYSRLADDAASVMHCAAVVNMNLEYASLRGSNVESTRRVIEFASTGRRKDIQHISSMAIFDCLPALNAVDESTDLDRVGVLRGGYAQSKWVAEKMLFNARAMGLEVSVYRCPRVWGNLHSGYMPPNDLIWRLVAGCVDVGHAPDIDIRLDVTPACFIANAIVALAYSDGTSRNRCFNLVNPNSLNLSEIFRLLGDMGAPLDKVEYGVWFGSVRADQVQGRSGARPFVVRTDLRRAQLGQLGRHLYRRRGR